MHSPAQLHNPQARPGSPANEAVAIVSSCAHLPGMMEVWPLRDWLSTAFHTLLRGRGREGGGGAGRGGAGVEGG